MQLKPIITTILLMIIGFGIKAQEEFSLAKVEREQGFYLFFKSEPAGEFEILGAEKIKVVVLSNDECINKIFKKARNYPGANGLIFKELNYCEAEIIELKKN